MNRMVEFELETVNEKNQREHWRKRAERTSAQREATRTVLEERLPGPPPRTIDGPTGLVSNLCVVVFTRIAPRLLDDGDNLPLALSAVRDEVAAWMGLDSDRDPTVTWRYAQRRGAPREKKVRVEIVDGAPGAPVRVVLATEAEARSLAPPPPAQATLTFMRGFAALPWEQRPCGGCGASACRCHLPGAGNAHRCLEERKLARGVPPGRVYCADEWCDCRCHASTCGACGGKVRRVLLPLDVDAEHVERLDFRAPPEHAEAFPTGAATLYRRRWTSERLGECWLFETRGTDG